MDLSLKNIFKIFIVIIVIFLVALMAVYVFKKAKEAWTGEDKQHRWQVEDRKNQQNWQLQQNRQQQAYKMADSAQNTLNQGFNTAAQTIATNSTKIVDNMPQNMDAMGKFINTVSGETQSQYNPVYQQIPQQQIPQRQI